MTPFAKVYVAGSSREALTAIVEDELGVKAEWGSVEGDHLAVDVRDNDDHKTPPAARTGPDFLYFPHHLDVEATSPDAPVESFTAQVAALLRRLDAAGLAYVTAADIEADLPNAGRSSP